MVICYFRQCYFTTFTFEILRLTGKFYRYYYHFRVIRILLNSYVPSSKLGTFRYCEVLKSSEKVLKSTFWYF